MSGSILYSVERDAYTSCTTLMNALVVDLMNNGFRVVFPADFVGNIEPASSSLLIDSTAANGDVTYTAVTPGVGGNAITIAHVDPLASNATLSVNVVGKAITVNLATGDSVAASALVDGTNADSDITYTAVTAGILGNDIRIEHIDPAVSNATLSVVVSGTDITVNLATDGGGAVTTIASEVVTAIANSVDASALVTAVAEGTGGGVVEAVPFFVLIDGSNGVIVSTSTEVANIVNSTPGTSGLVTAVSQGTGLGIVAIAPTTNMINGADIDNDNPIIVVEPESTTDVVPQGIVSPWARSEPWRILFQVVDMDSALYIYVATPTQIADDGTIASYISPTAHYSNSYLQLQAGLGFLGDPAYINTDSQYGFLARKHYIAISPPLPPNPNWSGYIAYIVGDKVLFSGVDYECLVSVPAPISGAPANQNPFIATTDWTVIPPLVPPNTFASAPMSYRLTVTDHGIAFFVWEDAQDDSGIRMYSYAVIQYPVDKITGNYPLLGHHPLFCLFGVHHNQVSGTFRIVAREADVSRPTVVSRADVYLEDTNAVLNPENQVSMTESYEYVITFPNNLTTQRFLYVEELDLIAYTSADVISEDTDVPVTVYSETRNYRGMVANKTYNTGMRILLWTNAGQGPMGD